MNLHKKLQHRQEELRFVFLEEINIIVRMREQSQRIAVIDNSLDHSIYHPIRHWKICLGREFDVFNALEKDFPDVKDFSHIILTGSEASILEREEWAEEEIRLIKEAKEKGVSLLGSCYGHQLLAVALAGPQHVQRCQHPEIGWIRIQINGTDGFLGKKRHAQCFSSHLDEVIDLPENFLILASSDQCSIQAFRMSGQPVWGLQIHPEINIIEAQKYLESRVHERHEPLELFQRAFNSYPRDSGLIRHVNRNFFG
jgi:GMP synthase-like glutamine amidotransferase